MIRTQSVGSLAFRSIPQLPGGAPGILNGPLPLRAQAKGDDTTSGNLPGPPGRSIPSADPVTSVGALAIPCVPTVHQPGIYGADKFAPGQLALTFDDGPVKGRTGKILRSLRDHGVKATFFVNGQMITRSTFQLIKTMVADGQTIGNHTQHHYNALAKKTPVEIEMEYRHTQAMVSIALAAKNPDDFSRLQKQVTHLSETLAPEAFAAAVDALLPADATRYTLLYSRPPGGNPYYSAHVAQRDKFDAVLAKLGVYNILWTHESKDSNGNVPEADRKNAAKMAASVTRYFKPGGAIAKHGGVVLMHDRIPPAAVEAILDDLAGKPDFEVVGLDALMKTKEEGCSAAGSGES